MCAPALGIIPALGSSTGSAQGGKMGLETSPFKAGQPCWLFPWDLVPPAPRTCFPQGWNLDLSMVGAEPVPSLSARENHKNGTESSGKQNLEAWRGGGHGDTLSMAAHCVFWGWAALPGCRSLAHPTWTLWSCRKQLQLGINQEDVSEARPGVNPGSGNVSGASSLPVQNPSPAGWWRVP